MSVIATDMLAGTAADRLDAGAYPRLSTDFLNRFSEAVARDHDPRAAIQQDLREKLAIPVEARRVE